MTIRLVASNRAGDSRHRERRQSVSIEAWAEQVEADKARDRRERRLERRIAELERRLAALEAGTGPAHMERAAQPRHELAAQESMA